MIRSGINRGARDKDKKKQNDTHYTPQKGQNENQAIAVEFLEDFTKIRFVS